MYSQGRMAFVFAGGGNQGTPSRFIKWPATSACIASVAIWVIRSMRVMERIPRRRRG